MKKYCAEFLGTFVLTLFGCGTAVITGCAVDNPGAYLLTALAFGLSVVAMAYSIGHVSGCHINPAISIAMLLDKRLSGADFIGYIVSQCLGGILAGFLLSRLALGGVGANGLYKNSVILSIVIEIILTFVFVLLVLTVTANAKLGNAAGALIGATLTFVHILGIGFTGTSVNPARSLVNLFGGAAAIQALPVFIIAPLIGGILAVLVYKAFKPAE